jgi:dipeptide/tripeptide permease
MPSPCPPLTRRLVAEASVRMSLCRFAQLQRWMKGARMASAHTSTHSAARLKAFVLAVVVGHACVVVWHLVVVANINPAVVTPGFLVFLGTINLFPFVAVALPNTRVRLLAGWLLLIPFGLALAAGLISHFLSPGPDNVFHIAAGNWTRSYRVSALLLVLLETVGCWLAATVLRRP